MVIVALVLSKAEVAIPRLELLPCIVLAESVVIVSEALSTSTSIQNFFGWSDSLDILYWIERIQKQSTLQI